MSGSVFKVERGPAGEKIAFVRMFSGAIRTRDRIEVRGGKESKVTAISVFDGGSVLTRPQVTAGQIGKLWGLGEIQIGDAIGVGQHGAESGFFAPPTLETVIAPTRLSDKGNLQVALSQLAEQDPLINLRQDDVRQETYVSLYGEVQKEVIQTTLASEFGIDVTFRETTTICIERLNGSGAAVEFNKKDANPFLATIGLRVELAAGELRGVVQPRGRARFDAVLVHQGGRGDRVRDVAARDSWLADPGREGGDDALRVLGAAESRARGVRQEHVEHGRRLPESDAVGADDGAA